MRPGPLALLLALAAPSSAAAQTIQRVPRPPPLQAQPRCELYRGSASGNSDALVEIRLCPADDGTVNGTHQWSSTTSGWSQRELTGRWEGERFVAREARFVESRPAPGWRFCLIDRMELTQVGERLDGTFVSEECSDTGSFELARVAEPAPPAAPPPPRSPPPPARRSDSDGGALGLCAASPGSGGGAGGLSLAVVASLLRARRRWLVQPRRARGARVPRSRT